MRRRSHSVRKLRITGGEPLLRKDLTKRSPAGSSGIQDMALTTNGVPGRPGAKLYDAGLRRLNIHRTRLTASASSKSLTRRFGKVMDGIEAVLRVGTGDRINAVAVKNLVEGDIVAGALRAQGIEIRYRSSCRWTPGHLGSRQILLLRRLIAMLTRDQPLRGSLTRDPRPCDQ